VHDASGQLCGHVQKLGDGVSGVFAGLAALWHWRLGHGALAAQACGRAAHDNAGAKAVVFRVVFRQLLFSICMLYGMSMTSAVAAGVIMASIPACVAVMSWLFLRERVAPRVWVAVVCAVLGIAFVSLVKEAAAATSASPSPAAHSTAWLGNLLVLGAVLCESAYAVIGKKLTGALGPRRISSLINLWGFALVTPLGVWQALQFDFGGVASTTWVLLVFYALAASVWTVWLWMTGLKTVPAAQAGVFTVMLPISAAAVGVLVLGERMSGMQLLAFAIALVGVVLATAPERKAAV
jgi:drug/metabolite transporter (DMT)-like permease